MSMQEKYDAVDELLDIIAKLIAVYTDFQALNTKKQQVLATGNLTELQRSIQQEEDVVAAIALLEERRAVLQNTIDGSHISFRQLIALLEEPRKGRALSLAQKLGHAIQAVKAMQEANAMLLHTLLTFVKHKRNLLYQVSTVPDYGANNHFVNNRSIINKVI